MDADADADTDADAIATCCSSYSSAPTAIRCLLPAACCLMPLLLPLPCCSRSVCISMFDIMLSDMLSALFAAVLAKLHWRRRPASLLSISRQRGGAVVLLPSGAFTFTLIAQRVDRQTQKHLTRISRECAANKCTLAHI